MKLLGIAKAAGRLALMTLLSCAAAAPPDYFVYRATAKYPTEAASKGIEGFVKLRIKVSQEGKVVDVSIREAKPVGVFEESAKAAALMWQFVPRCGKGFDTAFAVEQTINFKISYTGPVVFEPVEIGHPKMGVYENPSGGVEIGDEDPCAQGQRRPD